MTLVRYRSRILRYALVLFLILYVPVRVFTLDAYGQCRKLDNFNLCFDAWTNIKGGSTPFKKLMTDDEMINQLTKNRSEFEALVEDVQKRRDNGMYVPPRDVSDPRWLAVTGVMSLSLKRDPEKPLVVCQQPRGEVSESCQRRIWKWAYVELRADKTRIIDAKFHPFSRLTKYYVYYPWEGPTIEGDRIYYGTGVAPTSTSQPIAWLVDSLDNNWPDGWLAEHDFPDCVMRRLDAHWYLKLCKNDIGG